jgi:hypothetical protein
MTAGPVTHPLHIVFCDRIYVCSFQALTLLLYRCEMCLLTLRQYHTLWVFENRVLRRVFWSKRKSNRRMERNDLYVVSQLFSTPAIITIIRTRLTGCVGMGRSQKCVRNFSRKSKGKRRTGRTRHGWEDSVKHTLKSKTWMWAGFIWRKI